MGVAGRDYMRNEGGSFPRWFPGRVTWTIIAINAVLWIVFSASVSWGTQGPWRPIVPSQGLGGFIWDQLLLHPDEVFARGKVWQLFTAFWLHDWKGAGHVFWNMLALYFFGRTVESHLGGRGYLKLYLGGGIVASVILTLYAYATGVFIPALGASGAVYAVLVWMACAYPQRIIYLMFVIRMPLWVAVGVFLVGMEVLTLTQHARDAGSAVGHLSGALWGFVYFRYGRRWLSERGAGGWIVKFRRKREAAHRAPEPEPEDEAVVRERVDALLQKISVEGIASLSEEEKQFLQDASRRFR